MADSRIDNAYIVLDTYNSGHGRREIKLEFEVIPDEDEVVELLYKLWDIWFRRQMNLAATSPPDLGPLFGGDD